MEHIFIGSSSEGLPFARAIKKALKSEYECYLWNENIFQLNNGTFDTLLVVSGIFDYAIFVMTKDDVVDFRGEKVLAPRDNVLFEFGLFLGRMGKARVIAVVEDDCKQLSDMKGVTITKFRRNKGILNVVNKQSIKDNAAKIKSFFQTAKSSHMNGIFPTVAIAESYINRFLLPIAKQVALSPMIDWNGSQVNIKRIRVVIPNILNDNLSSQFAAWCRNNNCGICLYSIGADSFPIHGCLFNNDLEIADMPSDLLALFHSIHLFTENNAFGTNNSFDQAQQRELRVFEDIIVAKTRTEPILAPLVDIIHI